MKALTDLFRFLAEDKKGKNKMKKPVQPVTSTNRYLLSINVEKLVSPPLPTPPRSTMMNITVQKTRNTTDSPSHKETVATGNISSIQTRR